MTWVKICGITNLEDALVAVEAGANAVGFVFYKNSPRNIDPETAAMIAKTLPANVEKVGVFVSDSKSDWFDIVSAVELTAIQQHLGARESPADELLAELVVHQSNRRFKVFHSLSSSSFLVDEQSIGALAEDFSRLRKRTPRQPRVPESFCETFFLDSGRLGQPGGTGEPFDWSKAIPIAEGMRKGGLKLVVAGGLTPENVPEAMRILHPWGVDVSSGVETRPGKKDPEKVRAFVKAVRDADKANSRN
jgi:phosphoribosylanthranilate isomerase